jgi:hypothetical protein
MEFFNFIIIKKKNYNKIVLKFLIYFNYLKRKYERINSNINPFILIKNEF